MPRGPRFWLGQLCCCAPGGSARGPRPRRGAPEELLSSPVSQSRVGALPEVTGTVGEGQDWLCLSWRWGWKLPREVAWCAGSGVR